MVSRKQRNRKNSEKQEMEKVVERFEQKTREKTIENEISQEEKQTESIQSKEKKSKKNLSEENMKKSSAKDEVKRPNTTKASKNKDQGKKSQDMKSKIKDSETQSKSKKSKYKDSEIKVEVEKNLIKISKVKGSQAKKGKITDSKFEGKMLKESEEEGLGHPETIDAKEPESKRPNIQDAQSKEKRGRKRKNITETEVGNNKKSKKIKPGKEGKESKNKMKDSHPKKNNFDKIQIQGASTKGENVPQPDHLLEKKPDQLPNVIEKRDKTQKPVDSIEKTTQQSAIEAPSQKHKAEPTQTVKKEKGTIQIGRKRKVEKEEIDSHDIKKAVANEPTKVDPKDTAIKKKELQQKTKSRPVSKKKQIDKAPDLQNKRQRPAASEIVESENKLETIVPITEDKKEKAYENRNSNKDFQIKDEGHSNEMKKTRNSPQTPRQNSPNMEETTNTILAKDVVAQTIENDKTNDLLQGTKTDNHSRSSPKQPIVNQNTEGFPANNFSNVKDPVKHAPNALFDASPRPSIFSNAPIGTSKGPESVLFKRTNNSEPAVKGKSIREKLPDVKFEERTNVYEFVNIHENKNDKSADTADHGQKKEPQSGWSTALPVTVILCAPSRLLLITQGTKQTYLDTLLNPKMDFTRNGNKIHFQAIFQRDGEVELKILALKFYDQFVAEKFEQIVLGNL